MGANIKYASSRRLRGIRLVFGIVFALSIVKFVSLARRLGYDTSGLGWFIDTSTLPPISHGPPGKHNAHHQDTAGGKAYSLKPLAYVFPQYHAIPENDEFWGEGFTEWVNVAKVEWNQHGLETLRPAEEIGYYNLLDYDVRKRYGDLVRKSG